MSSSYSANQYENAFKSHRLQSWTLSKHFKERGSSWTFFQGTWDLPSHIPPVHINPTARSQEGQERLKTWGLSQGLVQSATDDKHHVGSRASSKTSLKKNTNGYQLHEEQQDQVSSPAPDPSQDLEQDQVSSPAPDPSQDLMPENPMSLHSQAQSRPATQQSAAESQPASKQNKNASRPTSQPHQVESRLQNQASKAKSRPVSQQTRLAI